MKINNLKYQIAAGVILVICGTLVLLSDYIKDKRDVVFSEMNLVLSSINMDENLNNQDNITSDESEEPKEEKNDNYTYEEYLGIVDISKIGLYKGFYNKNSNLNNVKFNLYVLPESNYPDTESGNLIIAGHSGNYNNSYFANLYLLELGDTINIHYNNKNYVYKIDKIYNEEKTGRVRILRNKSKTTLTLITCTKDDNYHQTIYIAYLISVE
ncbi:MAG: sortase [Firmicutes bacterium]|nr:sortase [Bacillota bacterium]MDY5335830.1 sortase [Bacilli bacterium]